MTRTLMIGLDGATFTLLDTLMHDGVMPALRRIVAGGVRGDLQSTVHPMTAQAWPSMMTGCTPGRHGMFDFVSFEETEAGIRFNLTSSRDCQCETIWSIASRQGLRVTALNFYGTYPPEPVNGHMIGGFVPWRHLKSATYPPDLYHRLRSLPGIEWRELGLDLDLEKVCIQGLPRERYVDWIRLHTKREQNWFRALHYLMETEPSDLTAIVIDGVDKLQHLCWRFLDPGCLPAAPTTWETEIRALCLNYYRQLDDFLDDTIRRAGPQTRVFITSDHGFGATNTIFYVNTWLADHGYLRWSEASANDDLDRLTAERIREHPGLFDWRATQAFAISPSSNGIFIRQKSERWNKLGAIDPVDYPAFREQLRKQLLSARDPHTQRPLVTQVLTREEAYPGPLMQMAPDLVLQLPDHGFFSVLKSDAVTKPRAETSGTHRPNGVFIAGGPGIEQGATLTLLSILEVAPILLHSLGLPLPRDMEGRVPPGVFRSEVAAPRFVEPDTPLPVQRVGGTGSSSDEADEAIMDRLYALSYIERPGTAR